MTKPTTPAERIQRAADELAAGAPDYAQASALVAIAQILERTVPAPVTLQVCPDCNAIATAER